MLVYVAKVKFGKYFSNFKTFGKISGLRLHRKKQDK